VEDRSVGRLNTEWERVIKFFRLKNSVLTVRYKSIGRNVLGIIIFSYFCIPLRRKGNSEKEERRTFERRVKEKPGKVYLEFEELKRSEK
jgi:hypothetical protein